MIAAGSQTEVRASTTMDYRQLSSIMGQLTRALCIKANLAYYF